MKRIIFVPILCFCAAVSQINAQRQPVPSVRTERLQEHFYAIEVHQYVNILAFNGQEGVLLVDSGMEPVGCISDELTRIGCGDVRYIVNTHSNGDHILGNAVLGRNARIISSAACREDMLARVGFPPEGLPDITFSEEMQFEFNGETIMLSELPGHTGNDIVVHFTRQNIVCVGDLVFPDSFPGIQAGRGGNAFLLEKSLRTIVDEFPRDARYVLGHGGACRWEDIRNYHRIIVATIATIRPLMETGLTVQEIKERDPLEQWRFLDSSFFPGEITAETWIENVVESF